MKDKKNTTPLENQAPKHASSWQIFARNKLAIIGLCFILFWVLLAVLAPVISPFDPLELNFKDKLVDSIGKPLYYSTQVYLTDNFEISIY